ncbi:MAG: hypothetical protein RL623_1073 [Actinomycetota bacterium]|jgi:hypothetical protein
MIRLEAATVMLQWSVGGLAFLWFTSRRNEVGAGYGILLRITYGVFAALAVVLGNRYGVSMVREASSVAVAISAFVLIRNKNPKLDLIAPLLGVPGIVAAGISAASEGAGSDMVVSLLRIVVGTLFLGAVSDTMLLGHWYLVQPGMPRKLINEITSAVIYLWPFEVLVLLLPTGMISVLNGSIDDGWDGVLGWFWLASALVTGVLALVTRAALKERSYSAVMAATGLMYLAILTAFCTDIVARALLA